MSEFLDTPELQDKVIVRLVDDDKDFLRSMKLMLEMMGWKVRDFSLAQDFLQEENFKVPGCIVLDMRMPGMTGLELQRQLINDKEKLKSMKEKAYMRVKEEYNYYNNMKIFERDLEKIYIQKSLSLTGSDYK